MREYDEYIKRTVIDMRIDRVPPKDIAATLGVPVPTIYKWIQDTRFDAAATLQGCSYELTEIARHMPRRPANQEDLNSIADRLDAVLRVFNL